MRSSSVRPNTDARTPISQSRAGKLKQHGKKNPPRSLTRRMKSVEMYYPFQTTPNFSVQPRRRLVFDHLPRFFEEYAERAL